MQASVFRYRCPELLIIDKYINLFNNWIKRYNIVTYAENEQEDLMKRTRFHIFLIAIITIINGCEKPFIQDPVAENPLPEPPYTGLEERIREKYDHRAVFTWDQYMDLLTELSKDKYLVLPLDEMKNTFSESKVVIGMRHDIDMNPFKALEMVGIERDFGFRTTYFVLPTADYYGYMYSTGLNRNAGLDPLIRDLYDSGAEIGMHNDMLTAMIDFGFDPFIFNGNELAFIRSLGIPVTGTSSHGSPIARITVPNYQIFSDFAKSVSVVCYGNEYPIGKYSLADYGYEYEAYFLDFDLYFSESGGKWNDVNGFSGILEQLARSLPGTRIQILTHPDWWGKAIN